MTTRRLPRAHRATVALAAGALLTALTGCSTLASASPTAQPSPAPSPTSTRHSATVTAVAIGDSIAIGNGVPADDAWPLLVADRFGWTLSDFAESAAGFTVKGLNTHTFDDQVSAAIRLHPEVVLIAGTRNDVFAGTPALKTAVTSALQRLRTALPDARIIGVGPLWGSEKAPAQIAVIDSTVKAAVLAVDGTWVELGQPFEGRSDLVQADHVHPTVEGQQLLAQKIANGIASQSSQR
ncbi:SGNH/GDSL hydrolase family protein [Leifsonia xyli]|uniref:SGNH/GDSL hydrolase family protein n=1 Tax=Leifsonia xyli TaxID=1575 RepID=UPI003D6674CD